MSRLNTFSDARLIWGAGLRRDAGATGRLLSMLADCPPQAEEKLYALCWALGRLGDPQAAPLLEPLRRSAASLTVRRMATEAVRMLLTGEAFAAFQQSQREALPINLQASMVDAPTLSRALDRHLSSARGRGRGTDLSVLHTLYLVDDEMSRAALATALATAPLKKGWMQPVRYIFKAAEYREDPLFFGLLARRFDECLATGEAGKPWSIATRTYLRRRVWRTLRRLAVAGDAAAYTKLAAGVLLAYDQRGLMARVSAAGVPLARQPKAVQQGGQRPQLLDEAYAYNSILYTPDEAGAVAHAGRPGTSSRRTGAQLARARARRLSERTEPHRELWDAAPSVLLQLMMDSDIVEVVGFAARALEDNPSFCQAFSPAQTLALLQRPTIAPVALGFSRLMMGDLVLDAALEPAALGAMYRLLASGQERLVSRAVAWLGTQQALVRARPTALARLLLTEQPAVRAQVRGIIDAEALSAGEQGALLSALVDAMIAAPPDGVVSDEVDALMARALPSALRQAPSDVIGALLGSRAVRLEGLAARLLLERDQTPDWPLLQGLLDASSPAARRVGLGFLGALSDDDLRTHQEAVVALTVHGMSDVREGVRVLIRRMVADPLQARALAARLLQRLASQPEHIAASLEATLTRDLSSTVAEMMVLDPEPLRVLMGQLLHRATSAPVGRVGLWLLSLQGDAVLLSEQSLLLSLASHERAALRESVRPLLRGLGERHPDFAADFTEQLLSRLLSPVFGGGPYNIHFLPPVGQPTAALSLDSYRLARRRQGWPDQDGGLLQAPPGAPIELMGASQDDQTSGWVDVGFDFWLAGTALRRFRADSNGWLRFEGSWKGTYDNAQAWSRNSAVALFPWWADLKTAPDGHVRTWLAGSPGDQVRVVEWRVWPHYAMRDDEKITLTFQACLHEGDQRIVYRYGPRDIVGSPKQARSAASGVKLDTTAQVEGQVRDFFGLHGTPAGSKAAFRTNLSCLDEASSYPGGPNIGLLSTQARGLAAIQARFADIGETLLVSFEPVLRQLPLERIEGLLSHGLAPVQLLGARILLIHHLPPADLPPRLIGQLIGSPHAAVRTVGVTLLERLSDAALLSSPALIHQLATHPEADVRQRSQDLIERLVTADVGFGAALITPLLEDLDANPGHAEEVSEVLRRILKRLPTALLRDHRQLLLEGIFHPLSQTRRAFRIASRRAVEGDLSWCLSFSQAVLDRMGDAEPSDVQQLASELILTLRDLLAALPESALLDEDLIYGLCAHPHPEMRQAAEPLLERVMGELPALAVAVGLRLLKLVRRDAPTVAAEAHLQRLLEGLSDAAVIEHPQLIVQVIRTGHPALSGAALHRMRALVAVHGEGQRFTDALLGMLFWREAYEGGHEAIIAILRADLASFLGQVPARSIWRLLKAPSTPAMELAAELVATIDADDVPLKKLAELADHRLLSVRTVSWSLYEQSVARLRADIGAGLGILDAEWDDSRAFAFRFFAQHFDEDTLTAPVLVGIVDSIRPDVQDFGRKLIGRFFGDEDGPEYLLKLSQHPAPNVELFVTNYLERFASGQPDRVEALVPYFRRVLTRVNSGRAAKARVLLFLQQEQARCEGSAVHIAALLGWLSALDQVGDRAAVVALMLDLMERYPHLDVPLSILLFPRREGGHSAV